MNREISSTANLSESHSTAKAIKKPTTSELTRKRWKQRIAKISRWLHIYGSMFSCAVVLFFSVTGITLNHPAWFDSAIDNTVQKQGKLDPNWVAMSQEETDGTQTDQTDEKSVAKLDIVEYLRSHEHVHGAVSGFTIDSSQCIVAFRGPGYSADTFIDRATGQYELVENSMGLVALLNDLHKGRDSGPVWAWVIDLSAGLLVFVSLTGMILLFYIHRHRRTGFATAIIGTLVTVAIYLAFVPLLND